MKNKGVSLDREGEKARFFAKGKRILQNDTLHNRFFLLH